MKNFISVKNLSKVYANNFKALDQINLEIEKGEIFALLGPNGAGKSTLINIICGIVTSSFGKILVNNFDIKKDYRKTRSMIGVVPQEFNFNIFEKVQDILVQQAGYFGVPYKKAQYRSEKYTDGSALLPSAHSPWTLQLGLNSRSNTV